MLIQTASLQVFSEIQDELQAALEGEAGSARCHLDSFPKNGVKTNSMIQKGFRQPLLPAVALQGCVHSCIWCHWQWKGGVRFLDPSLED